MSRGLDLDHRGRAVGADFAVSDERKPRGRAVDLERIDLGLTALVQNFDRIGIADRAVGKRDKERISVAQYGQFDRRTEGKASRHDRRDGHQYG